jgi:hypothetical protein
MQPYPTSDRYRTHVRPVANGWRRSLNARAATRQIQWPTRSCRLPGGHEARRRRCNDPGRPNPTVHDFACVAGGTWLPHSLSNPGSTVIVRASQQVFRHPGTSRRDSADGDAARCGGGLLLGRFPDGLFRRRRPEREDAGRDVRRRCRRPAGSPDARRKGACPTGDAGCFRPFDVGSAGRGVQPQPGPARFIRGLRGRNGPEAGACDGAGVPAESFGWPHPCRRPESSCGRALPRRALSPPRSRSRLVAWHLRDRVHGKLAVGRSDGPARFFDRSAPADEAGG